MRFLVTMGVTIALVFLLRTPLKRFPWLFYALTAGVCVTGLWLFFLPATERPALLAGFSFIMRRGYLALALFALVMFVGVFGDESFVRRALQPIRAELSIVAAILIAGHFLPYLTGYLQQSASGLIRMDIIASLSVSLVLLVLLAILTVTSFAAVKRRMKPAFWKRLQRLAYIFFLLVYAHLAAFLLPSALRGSPVALESIVIYSALFLTYAVLRIYRSLRCHQTAARRTGEICES